MTTALKLRRGTTSQHSTFTGGEGEVTVDTTKDTVVVHDGATAGGFPLLKEANPSYTGTLTGGTGVVNIGSGQLYKTAGGNIGIGTTGPTSKLNVVGGRTDFSANNEPYALGVRYGSGAGIFYVGATNSATPDLVFSQVGGSEKMRLTNGGNLGISAINPAQKLQIGVGGSNDYLQFGATNEGFVVGRENASGQFISNATQASPYNVWRWQQGGTDRLVINASGTLELTSGQLKFPATQSASSDANTLDDYEEGTWTPNLTSTTGTLTTVANGTGYYTKVGRVVTIVCRPVITTNGTGASALRLGGLPFTALDTAMLAGAAREDAVVGWVFGISAATGTQLYIAKYDNTYPGGNGHAFPICITYTTS